MLKSIYLILKNMFRSIANIFINENKFKEMNETIHESKLAIQRLKDSNTRLLAEATLLEQKLSKVEEDLENYNEFLKTAEESLVDEISQKILHLEEEKESLVKQILVIKETVSENKVLIQESSSDISSFENEVKVVETTSKANAVREEVANFKDGNDISSIRKKLDEAKSEEFKRNAVAKENSGENSIEAKMKNLSKNKRLEEIKAKRSEK